MLEGWSRAASGWGEMADVVRAMGMPVSEWLIDHLELQPGQQLLELAAGPGDTGFLAAELIRPGGTLISSDAAEEMLEVARRRAEQLGVDNVEFKQLQLEWIDLPTGSVDAAVCRWGYMLAVDPETALRETRRVLRPGGRLAFAVWAEADLNPWATVPGRTAVELGHAPPPDPDGTGPFSLASREKLTGLLDATGFDDVEIEPVEIDRTYPDIGPFFQETFTLSPMLGALVKQLSDAERNGLIDAMTSAAAPFTAADGSVRFPGVSLAVAARA
jgi:SAM-dependent methyltransferase